MKHDSHVQGYFCTHLLPAELCRELTVRIPAFYFRAFSCLMAGAYMTISLRGSFAIYTLLLEILSLRSLSAKLLSLQDEIH